ncbi:MAG: hypothetical protein AB7L90_10955 [Hyphomicrobiaceae bacterium]
MSQTPSRMVLTTARTLIAERRSWLQHGWIRFNRHVMRRCAYQAVVDAARMLGLEERRPLALLADEMAGPGIDPREAIPVYNDNHPHAEILAMFDRALAKT